MAKSNKSSRNNTGSLPDNLEPESATQNPEADAPQAQVAAQQADEPVFELEAQNEPEAMPFVFQTAGGSPAEGADKSQGQFAADDMEFESWMFDAGEGRGIIMPGAPSAQEVDPEGAPVTGQPVETPDFAGAFVQDPSVPESPMDAIYASAQDSSLDIEKLLSGISDPEAVPPSPTYVPDQYPASPEGWDDQMLASVDDFSAVLLALQSNVSAPPLPQVPVAQPEQYEAESYAHAAPQEAPAEEQPFAAEESWPQWLEQVENVQPPPQAQASTEPVAEVAQPEPEAPVQAEQTEVVQPPWQLGDMQEHSVAMPVEMTHEPEAYMAPAVAEPPAEPMAEPAVEMVAEPDFSSFEQPTPLAEAPYAAQPEPDFSGFAGEPAQPEAEWDPSGPDFQWLEPGTLTGEQAMQAAEPEAAQYPEYVPVAEAEAQPAPVTEYQEYPDYQNYQNYQEPVAAEGYADAQPMAPQDAQTPEWSTTMDENLPPWLMEAAASGIESPPDVSPSYPEPSYAQFEETGAQAAAEVQFPAETPAFDASQLVMTSAQPFQPMASTEQTAGEDEPTGQFAEAEMEFETWMFDEGKVSPLPSLPGMAQLVPVVQNMEPAVAWQSPAVELEAERETASHAIAAQEAAEIEMLGVQPADEDLPFWLQDRPGNVQPAGDMPALAIDDFPSFDALTEQPEVQTFVAVQEPPAQPEPEPVPTFDFAELPPIEPFDFSLLQPVQEEEGLGFSTEELTSIQPREHEPLMVTANLDVLADLLGKERAGVVDKNFAPAIDNTTVSHLLTPQQVAPQQPVAEVAPVVQPQPQVQPEVSVAREPEPAAEPVTPEKEGSWTSVATSTLSPETVANLSTAPTHSEDPAVVPMERTHAVTVSDLNVSPFDISELNLDTDETETEFLTGSMTNHPVAQSQSQSPAKILTGTLFTPSGAQGPDYWEAPAWMADVVEEARGGAERNTSLFPAARMSEVDSDGDSTQFLSGRGTREADTTENVNAVFKARVSRFHLPEEPSRDTPTPSQPAAYEAAAPVPVPSGPVTYTAPAVDISLRETSTGPAAPTMTSGPLGKLTGFENLEQMVAARPDEVGPHMALAVAYAQSGHIEHALYEYKRILSSRKVPAPMLQILSDQLDDIEAEAAGLARFHQLRGDLYMKQGRFEEAIEEYNKIK